MTELLTSAQMRAIEQAAIASGTVTGLELMERAGAGVVAAVLAEWPELAEGTHRAVVLCGPGNNGGDGFVVARLLKERGWAVEVFLYGDPERLPPDARVNYGRWSEMGEVQALDPATEFGGEDYDLLVDALFGTGLTRPVQGLGPCFFGMGEERLFHREDRQRAGVSSKGVIVAVDLPSGLCADSGRPLISPQFRGLPHRAESPAAAADLTVTFHAMKAGHVLAAGPTHCGKVVVADIGLPGGGHAGLARLIGTPPRDALSKTLQSGNFDTHKYTHGHALILSGGPGRCGAARLAARGALRIGAGLATLACPPEALPENAARLDAIMLRPVAEAAALAEILKDERINALCLGPGLGLGARESGLVAAALAERRPTILDADALTLIARNPALFSALHDTCVLTPHGGEFARLFPDIADKLAAPATTGPAFSKVDATRAAAARAGCVVLFKGPDTVIADPEGRAAIHCAAYDRAAPWLATAGSGDVLSGLTAGLLARGFGPLDAAATATFLHTEAARAFGPGLIAEDLPEMLPKVLRDLGVT